MKNWKYTCDNKPIDDGYFSNIIVFISISDDAKSKSIENSSAKLLSTNKQRIWNLKNVFYIKQSLPIQTNHLLSMDKSYSRIQKQKNNLCSKRHYKRYLSGYPVYLGKCRE